MSRQLLQHPNVTLGAYAGPLSEFDLRQAVKDPDRKAGLKSSEREFGASEHSHAMLQDADLQTRIQVRCLYTYICSVNCIGLIPTGDSQSFWQTLSCDIEAVIMRLW